MAAHRGGRVLSVAMALLMSIFVMACGSDDEETGNGGGQQTTTPRAEAPKANPDLQGEIKIGAAIPLTGPSATIGKDQQRGAELAMEAVNAGDGVLGKKLTVVSEDSTGTSAPAVQAARKLVTVDKVPVVVGEYLSNNTIAIGEYLQRTGVVQIQPGSSSTDIENIGDFSFSSIALDDIAGGFAAQTLYDAGYRTVGYLGPNNAYGTEFGRVLTEEFEKLGGTVAESIAYTEGQTSYRAELGRLNDSPAEAYVVASYVPDAVTINREAFQLGIEASKVYGIYLSLITEDSDPQAIAGMQGQDLDYVGPNGDSYLEAYRAKYGEDPPTPYSAYVYDAVMMAAEAINKAGNAEPDAIRTALEEVGQGYEGATGTITFDQDRQREAQEYALQRVSEDGTLETVDTIQGPAQ